MAIGKSSKHGMYKTVVAVVPFRFVISSSQCDRFRLYRYASLQFNVPQTTTKIRHLIILPDFFFDALPGVPSNIPGGFLKFSPEVLSGISAIIPSGFASGIIPEMISEFFFRDSSTNYLRNSYRVPRKKFVQNFSISSF